MHRFAGSIFIFLYFERTGSYKIYHVLIGEAGPDYWTENTDQCGKTQLGKSVPKATRREERKDYRFLLWSTPTGQRIERAVRHFQI